MKSIKDVAANAETCGAFLDRDLTTKAVFTGLVSLGKLILKAKYVRKLLQ
jgi:hypothetical protein